MDLLDRMRNTTVADLEGVRSDFDDDTASVYVPRKRKEMVRIVEGATDLKVNRPAPKNPGMVKTSDWTDNDTTPSTPRDARSEGQIRYMDNLIAWITEKDEATGRDARVWTDNVTAAGKWSYDKSDKFSISGWIDRLKAKNAELNAAAKAAPKSETWDDIPNGYYAVANSGPDDIHYFRVSRYRSGDVKIQEQASDTLHPVYGGRAKAVLTTIRTVGAREASELYGRTIGRCGRCNRTLTNAESRAVGIGLDCRSKM